MSYQKNKDKRDNSRQGREISPTEKAQIAKATRDYYQMPSYRQADKIREKMETKARNKVAQKLKLEDKSI